MKAINHIQSLIIRLPGRPDGMLAQDLAKIYHVKTGRLNEAVKRNKSRFPEDFMFQITKEERKLLESQNAIFQGNQGVTTYLPYIFTQYGANQLSSILKSDIAIKRSIQIIRAFMEYGKTKTPTNYLDALKQLVVAEEQKLVAEKLHKETVKELEYKEDIIITLVDDIDLASMRQVLNRVVRHNGAKYIERWRELYKQFSLKYHCNLQMRLDTYNKNNKLKLKNKLDYIDHKMNKLPQLYQIACKLYENDIKALTKELYWLNKEFKI